MSIKSVWLKRSLMVVAIIFMSALIANHFVGCTKDEGYVYQDENDSGASNQGTSDQYSNDQYSNDQDTDNQGDEGADVTEPSPEVAVCGDSRCSGDETYASCSADCPADCGDGECEGEETAYTCEVDCPASCGDGACTHSESNATCATDCPSACGNGTCGDGETAATCPDDCSATCGDGECEGEETAYTCEVDCPASCGDGACTHSETEASCPGDCTASGTTGYREETISAAGLSRSVSFYAPASRGANPPLVIAFHGTGDDSEEWIRRDNPDPWFETMADENGFMIAAPNSRHWDDGVCNDWDHHEDGGNYWETRCPGQVERGANPTKNPDLILVTEIINHAHETYGVDRNRIYALGFSNGGFFAYHVAMTMPNVIAAFAEGGAGLVNCADTWDCAFTTSLRDEGEGLPTYEESVCSTIAAIPPSDPANCAGAIEKPIAVKTTGRKVPGFLSHNNSDPIVRSFYTCNLARRMNQLGYDVRVRIRDGADHGFPEGFIPGAWEFFRTRSLP